MGWGPEAIENYNPYKISAMYLPGPDLGVAISEKKLQGAAKFFEKDATPFSVDWATPKKIQPWYLLPPFLEFNLIGVCWGIYKVNYLGA